MQEDYFGTVAGGLWKHKIRPSESTAGHTLCLKENAGGRLLTTCTSYSALDLAWSFLTCRDEDAGAKPLSQAMAKKCSKCDPAEPRKGEGQGSETDPGPKTTCLL